MNKKKYLALILGITLSLSSVVTANADTGSWVNNGGTWNYLKNGTKVTGWLQDGANWYYLQSNGDMKTGWLQDGGKWYYLYSNGVMAHDATVEGYYMGSSGAWINSLGTNTSNTSDEWTCPQIKSSAPSDVSAGFKILHDELGMGYTQGWAGYSTYVDNPTYVTPTALAVTKYYKSEHNAEIAIKIRQWANDPNVKNSYRVKPMAQQLFKFYFGDNYTTLYNILENDFSANLNKVVTIGNREVLITKPSNSAVIWVSAPGEHISVQ